MIQGTASGVGKSLIVGALGRYFKNKGIRVAPFKAVNMSNNAAVCADGSEIGRAQAAQAEACGLDPTVHMNPVLLKPGAGGRIHAILRGRPYDGSPDNAFREHAQRAIRESLEFLSSSYDLVLIEGAGSPAEINLRDRDMANMRVAQWANAPILLVGDIDRGGVFAHLFGTLQLLAPEDRSRVRGLIVNKFRGEIGALKPGIEELERITDRKVLGVVPYLRHTVPEEDAVFLPGSAEAPGGRKLCFAVVKLPGISNSDEFQPLGLEPDVSLSFVDRPGAAPPDLIIVPGTRSTVADVRFLRTSGLADWIVQCRRRGTVVMGICGGYQMLGRKILDPHGIESDERETEGLGLFDHVTTFEKDKVTRRVSGVDARYGHPIQGYEIHVGRTERPPAPPLLILSDGREEGVRLDRLLGTYVHGVFENAAFRRAVLNEVREKKLWDPIGASGDTGREKMWDELAASVSRHLDMAAIYSIIGLSP